MAAGWNKTPQKVLDRAAQLLAEGKTRREVQEAVGISHVIMAKHFPKGRDWNVWTQERIDKVREMLDDGMSHRDIEKTIGCSKNTILKYFPGSAWTRAQVLEMASVYKRFKHLQ